MNNRRINTFIYKYLYICRNVLQWFNCEKHIDAKSGTYIQYKRLEEFRLIRSSLPIILQRNDMCVDIRNWTKMVPRNCRQFLILPPRPPPQPLEWMKSSSNDLRDYDHPAYQWFRKSRPIIFPQHNVKLETSQNPLITKKKRPHADLKERRHLPNPK